MSVSVTDTAKIPYLAVWASRNGYPSPVWSSTEQAVYVPGAADAVVAAQVAGILTTSTIGVLLSVQEVAALPAGLDAVLATAKGQAKSALANMAQAVIGYLVSEDEMSDANAATRFGVYREVAAGGGTADEQAAVDAEIVAEGSGLGRVAYCQALLDSYADVRTAHHKTAGRMRKALVDIDAAATVPLIYAEIDAVKTYVITHYAGVTPMVRGAL